MSISVTLYAHIPGMVLQEDKLTVAGGQLVSLPFHEWTALDSEFKFTERKYQETSPVFWMRDIEDANNLDRDELLDHISALISLIHTALLLGPGTPLIPTPSLSTCYIETISPSEMEMSVLRAVDKIIGPMEREFIVFGSPLTYSYGRHEVEMVDSIYKLCVNTIADENNDEISAGISVLEETARPDSWYISDAEVSKRLCFVQCIAACENILLPPEDSIPGGQLTETFGKQAAALLAASEKDDKTMLAKYYSNLYRLRTDLMHGRPLGADSGGDENQNYDAGRNLLKDVLIAALKFRTSDVAGRQLWSLSGSHQDGAADKVSASNYGDD